MLKKSEDKTRAKDVSKELKPLNFRVPAGFHREFKVYASQHDMSMVDLLRRSFEVYTKKE